MKFNVGDRVVLVDVGPDLKGKRATILRIEPSGKENLLRLKLDGESTQTYTIFQRRVASVGDPWDWDN